MNMKETNARIQACIQNGKVDVSGKIAGMNIGRGLDLTHNVPYTKSEWKSMKDSDKDSCIKEVFVKLFSDDPAAILDSMETGEPPVFGALDRRGRDACIDADIHNARIVRDTVRVVAGIPVKVRYFSKKGKTERVLVMMENGICVYIDTPCSIVLVADFLKCAVDVVHRLSGIRCEPRTVAYLKYATGARLRPVLTAPDDRDELPCAKSGAGFCPALVDEPDPSEYPSGDGCETSLYADGLADELMRRKMPGV